MIFHYQKHTVLNYSYSGNIFTFKISFTAHRIFLTLKNRIKYSTLEFSVTKICVLSPLKGYFPSAVSHSFYWFFFLHCFQGQSPAAPSAALAAPGRPYLTTVGASVTAARVAVHWRSSPLVTVVRAGTAPPL